jgi:hypothetical protein
METLENKAGGTAAIRPGPVLGERDGSTETAKVSAANGSTTSTSHTEHGRWPIETKLERNGQPIFIFTWPDYISRPTARQGEYKWPIATWEVEEICPSERYQQINEWMISNPCIHGSHIKPITKTMAANLLRHKKHICINRHKGEITIQYALRHRKYEWLILTVKTA